MGLLVATMIVAAGACQQPAPVHSREVITIGLTNDNVPTIDGERFSMEDFERRLSELATRSPDAEVHLTFAPKSTYGVAAHLMAMAQRSGLKNLGVVGGT
jgi:biopolymer transport protein ExbD